MVTWDPPIPQLQNILMYVHQNNSCSLISLLKLNFCSNLFNKSWQSWQNEAQDEKLDSTKRTFYFGHEFKPLGVKNVTV